jgi:hypothetical protein
VVTRPDNPSINDVPISIRTIAHRSDFTAEALEAEHSGKVIACDFYVRDAELGIEVPGGYELGRVVNVDHHSPATRMMRHVSSANLAIERVKKCGFPTAGSLVVISHTDCDSVLSSCIMAGEIPPDDRFGEAAIAADHTGAPNGIADVLQSLDEMRDLYFSLRNLRKLLDGEPIDRRAQPLYEARLRKRASAQKLVANNSVSMCKSLAFGVLTENIDGEFFPAQLPRAALILILTPRVEPGRWNAKIRLGQRAPVGASLLDLGVTSFDPAFGGRWNAGSNSRNGGTWLEPHEYAGRIAQAMEESWGI